MAKNDKQPTYSEAITQLEGILGRFEEQSMDVDTLAAEVKRAVELISICRSRLRATDSEVNAILRGEKGGEQ